MKNETFTLDREKFSGPSQGFDFPSGYVSVLFDSAGLTERTAREVTRIVANAPAAPRGKGT